MGDANATVMLFEKLFRHDKEGIIPKMLKPGSREAYLPLHINASDISNLPQTAGVYYFHDKKDKVIYVGKAIEPAKEGNQSFFQQCPFHAKNRN